MTIDSDLPDHVSSSDIIARNIERLNATIKAISHPNRMRIMLTLSKGTTNTRKMAEDLGMKKTTLINHINAIIKQGLIVKQGHGEYVLTDQGRKMLQHLAKMIDDLASMDKARSVDLMRASVAKSFLSRDEL